MKHRLTVAFALAAGIVLGAQTGCGGIDDFPEEEPGDGPVCYDDSECVPDDCCGQGFQAVHVSQAPDCRGVVCEGTCRPGDIDCGCAYPICRDSRCVAARSFSEGCE